MSVAAVAAQFIWFPHIAAEEKHFVTSEADLLVKTC